MLKGIPSLLSPELLKIMMEMGHGDEIVLGDANFPAASLAQRLVRCDGHPIPVLLDAILALFPLDVYVDCPVSLMQPVPGDPSPAVWNQYRDIIQSHQPAEIQEVERFAFYERAQKAYAIVSTGETAPYGNIILKKGVVFPDND